VGYWRYMPLGYRLRIHFFLHVFSTLSHALLGYNAAGRWGIMENLPRGVVRDWQRWCSVPTAYYYYFDPRFAADLPSPEPALPSERLLGHRRPHCQRPLGAAVLAARAQ
jgi:hypothetical protein